MDFQGARLREIREARGLAGSELSEMLNVKRQSISNYELGKQIPPIDTISKMAFFLRVPTSFFYTPKSDIQHSVVFFRSLHSTTKTARTVAIKKLEWLKLLVGYLTRHLSLPLVNMPKVEVGSILEIDEIVIENLASEVRLKWDLGFTPIDNLMIAVESNGGIITRGYLATTSLDALSEWSHSEERPYFFLNADKESAVRSRFDLAHELGHMLLHRDMAISKFNRPEIFSMVEKQAHRFAASLLLPASDFVNDLQDFSLDHFVDLKSKWKTSVGMMIKRVSDLGLIDDVQETRLWKNYARRGWKVKEPLDNVLPIETPMLLQECFELFKKHDLIRLNDLSDILPLFPSELEKIGNLEEGFFASSIQGLSGKIIIKPIVNDN